MAKESLFQSFGDTRLDGNFSAIEEALNNAVLYRANPVGEPNQVEQELDMNSNDINNAGTVNAQSIVVGGVDLEEQINLATAAANAASVSESNALNSANDAAASSASAEASAIDSAASAADAYASEQAAAAFATNGFLPGSAYDLGFITDASIQFPTDLGGLV